MIELTMTPILWFLLIVFSSILDVIVGDPYFLIHPITIIKKFINFQEKILNKGKFRKVKGLILIIITITVVVTVFYSLQLLFKSLGFIYYILFNLWFLSTALSEKTIFLNGKLVKSDLKNNDIIKAREDTAKIIGRKTETLNRTELIKTIIDSEADNAIDEIIAPLFYMLIGLFLFEFTPVLNPLVVVYIYKTINTLDSVVGHNYEPYKEFGYYPAKLDDWINLIPARLGSVLILYAGSLIGYNLKEALLIFENYRFKHISPNAGHAEAAIAGLLQIKLGGTNNYDGTISSRIQIGIDKYPLKINDIIETMRIIIVTEELLLILASFIVANVYLINFLIKIYT